VHGEVRVELGTRLDLVLGRVERLGATEHRL
jgi:hypothetical protein